MRSAADGLQQLFGQPLWRCFVSRGEGVGGEERTGQNRGRGRGRGWKGVGKWAQVCSRLVCSALLAAGAGAVFVAIAGWKG